MRQFGRYSATRFSEDIVNLERDVVAKASESVV